MNAMNTLLDVRKQPFSLKFMHDVHRVFIARFTLLFSLIFSSTTKNFREGEGRIKGVQTSGRSPCFFHFFLFFFTYPATEHTDPNGGKLLQHKSSPEIKLPDILDA